MAEMEITVQPDSAGALGARLVAGITREKKVCVLDLATGKTPVKLYPEIIGMHRRDGLDFSRVTTFNLDEYLGPSPHKPASCHRFMREKFFDHVNVPEHRIHLADGLTPVD